MKIFNTAKSLKKKFLKGHYIYGTKESKNEALNYRKFLCQTFLTSVLSEYS